VMTGFSWCPIARNVFLSALLSVIGISLLGVAV
jgi:hypothetical protein